MEPINIKELYEACKKQIEKGNGNKVIMLSDDDEGNGYHYCWYTFSTPDEIMVDEYLINKNIATKENTIILG